MFILFDNSFTSIIFPPFHKAHSIHFKKSKDQKEKTKKKHSNLPFLLQFLPFSIITFPQWATQFHIQQLFWGNILEFLENLM